MREPCGYWLVSVVSVLISTTPYHQSFRFCTQPPTSYVLVNYDGWFNLHWFHWFLMKTTIVAIHFAMLLVGLKTRFVMLHGNSRGSDQNRRPVRGGFTPAILRSLRIASWTLSRCWWWRLYGGEMDWWGSLPKAYDCILVHLSISFSPEK